MPAADDHPMRLRRIRAGLTQVDLAKMGGVTRNVIAQIEEGRVRKPNAKVVGALAAHMNTTPEQIFEEVHTWRSTPTNTLLTLRALNALSLPPTYVAKYTNFLHWRRDIAPNPTSFASILRLPRATVIKYESGEVAMPKPMVTALSSILGLSDEYIEELRKLDVRN